MQPQWGGGPPPEEIVPSVPVPQQGPPQMPQQVPMPQGTLGQVVDQSQQQGPPPDAGGAMSDYAEAMQAAMMAYAPAMRQPLPPDKLSVGGVLANILTFGGMGIARHDYQAAYNERVAEHNAQVRAKVADTAFDLVQKKQEIAALGGRQNMALMGLNMRMMGLEETARNNQLAEAHRQWQRDRGNTMPPVLSPEGRAALEDEGWRQVPVPGMGGNVRLEKDPNSGAYRMPGAGTQMGDLLGGGGAAPAPGAPPPPSGGGSAGLAARRAWQKRQEEAASLQGKPLEGEDKKVVAAMDNLRNLTERLFAEYTPAERAKYAGVWRYRVAQGKQLFQNDPKFAAFDALLGQFAQTLFEKGGAALTKLERDTLMRSLPAGTEWGGAGEMEIKLRELYRSAADLKKQRLGVSGPRSDVAENAMGDPTEIPTTTPTTSTTSTTVPGEGRKTRRLSTGRLIVEE